MSNVKPGFIRHLLARLSRSVRPSHDAFFEEGTSHLRNGEFNAAIGSYRRAISTDPQNSNSYVSLGYALKESGDFIQAAKAFELAIQKNPQNPEAYYFAGSLALAQGKHESASEKLQTALHLNELLEPAYTEGALALFLLGRMNQALTLMSRAVNLMPESATLHFTMGNLLEESTLYSAAVEHYQSALTISPDFAEALANLGNCERHLGQTSQAIKHIDAAIKHQPENAAWHSTRLFTLQYEGKLTPLSLFEEHLKFAARFEAPLLGAKNQYNFSRFTGDRRLRVGYVSGDFRQHSLLYFFEPIVRHRNAKTIENFCYYTYPVSDEKTKRLQNTSDHWRNCATLSDDALSELIRSDGIDVLIDLSGHTGHNRLLTFARKPAPTQMTWLGYQATTGLSAIDYRITDAGMDPIGQTEKYHTEKLLRLSTAAVFEPDPNSPSVNELPFLKSRIFTYACLNNPAKITQEFISTTAHILRSVVNSKLILGNANGANSEKLLADFAIHGINKNQIVFVEKLGIAEYLSLHSKIDMALDTFPYNGGTTTMHSLWMGVPVLTLNGETAISRVGAQLMQGLGLHRFACNTIQEFIARGVELAASTEYMARTRTQLRPRMNELLVGRSKSFVDEFECALIKCAHGGKIKPKDID